MQLFTVIWSPASLFIVTFALIILFFHDAFPTVSKIHCDRTHQLNRICDKNLSAVWSGGRICDENASAVGSGGRICDKIVSAVGSGGQICDEIVSAVGSGGRICDKIFWICDEESEVDYGFV